MIDIRQKTFLGLIGLSLSFLITGCGAGTEPEIVWGERGVADGKLVKPRAAAMDKNDHIYLVDWTARIQAFDRDGKYLGKTWTTPDYRNGRPSGLSIGRDGNLIVSDSHYSCVRIYSLDGKMLRKFGGKYGTKPGELSYVSDTIQDKDGNYYVAEFGENQRISKFTQKGEFVKCWGAPGFEPGQFARIRAMALGPDNNIYVADACNHRIQVFNRDGKWLRSWGKSGKEVGELSYPYDLAFSGGAKPFLYVIEYGNCRVQKFTPDGKALGCWGGAGREAGKFYSPWALVVDSQGAVHAVDSENHRVQRMRF